MARDAERFRLVSYNVRYFAHAAGGLGSCRASRRKIAAALAALEPAPAVICLQEVETRSIRSLLGRPPKRPGETQLEAFMDSFAEATREAGRHFRYDAFYFRAHAYRAFGAVLYTTGLAILVDRERLRVEGHNAAAPAEITHQPVALLRDAKQSRICAHMALRTPRGTRLHVFNTHLSLPTPFARDFWMEKDRMGFGPNQVKEAQAVGAFVVERSGGEPYVLCGDFNAPPGSPVYRSLVEGTGCAGAQAALGQIGSALFPTAGFLRFRMHLDHLFSGGGLRWVDLEGTHPFGKGPFRGLSDHVPLVGRFEVAEK
jgi:endonuclease/exonuclease/phosphatase family metal-dependent hydrolase